MSVGTLANTGVTKKKKQHTRTRYEILVQNMIYKEVNTVHLFSVTQHFLIYSPVLSAGF